jgi:hypothetical protein
MPDCLAWPRLGDEHRGYTFSMRPLAGSAALAVAAIAFAIRALSEPTTALATLQAHRDSDESA